MEKNKFHAVIKQFYIKDNTPEEMKAELDEVHGTLASSFKTAHNWVNKFKLGRTYIRDKSPSGRPIKGHN